MKKSKYLLGGGSILLIIIGIIIFSGYTTPRLKFEKCEKDLNGLLWHCDVEYLALDIQSECWKREGIYRFDIYRNSGWACYITPKDMICSDNSDCPTNYCKPDSIKCIENCKGKCVNDFQPKECNADIATEYYILENGKVLEKKEIESCWDTYDSSILEKMKK